jgi:hypothetical protein
VLEALAAAIATALLSMGSASAMAAARRASETRDAVLVLTTQVQSLDSLLKTHMGDVRVLASRLDVIDAHVSRLDSRVTALESGVIDRRSGGANA